MTDAPEPWHHSQAAPGQALPIPHLDHGDPVSLIMTPQWVSCLSALSLPVCPP